MFHSTHFTFAIVKLSKNARIRQRPKYIYIYLSISFWTLTFSNICQSKIIHHVLYNVQRRCRINRNVFLRKLSDLFLALVTLPKNRVSYDRLVSAAARKKRTSLAKRTNTGTRCVVVKFSDAKI